MPASLPQISSLGLLLRQAVARFEAQRLRARIAQLQLLLDSPDVLRTADALGYVMTQAELARLRCELAALEQRL
jgi:hypothetical protein